MATAAAPSQAEVSAKLAAPGQDVQRSGSVKPAEPSRTTLASKSNERQPLAAIDETSDRPTPTQEGPSSGGEDSASEADDPLNQATAARERREGERGMRTEANIKSGYLMKKGERRKAWKKRFFVLRPKVICYYKNDKEYKLLRDVPLSSVHTVAEVSVKRHDHVFGIVTPQRTYYVEADSRADMLDWVRKVDEARTNAQRTTSEEQSLMTVDSKDITPREEGHTPTNEKRSQPMAIRQDSVDSSLLGHSYVSSSSAMSGDALSSSLGSSNGFGASPVVMMPDLASPRDEGAAIRLPAPRDSRQRQASGGNSSGNESSGYFPRLNTNVPAVAATIGSAGGMQSSSDEDEDDEFVPPTPSVQGMYGAFPLPAATPSQPQPPRIDVQQLDPRKVIMQGYLTKQGKRRVWRKRYFTLISSRLIYSHSHMDQKPARQIPLERIVDVLEYEPPTNRLSSGRPQSLVGQPQAASSPTAPDARYENVFKIITAKRTYIVCAPDEESLIKWISALRVLLQAKRTEGDLPKLVPPPIGRTPATPPGSSSGAAAVVANAPPRSGSGALPSIESKLEEANARPQHTRDRSLTNAARDAVNAVRSSSAA